jgi:hypothetical protein
VSETVVARIRTIAIARLLARQLDLENPQHRAAIIALIGRATFEVVSHERSRPATLSAVLRSLDALDALDTRHKVERRN